MALNLSSVTDLIIGCIVLFLSCLGFTKSMETKLPEIKAISTYWRRVDVFWQVKFVPKKPNLTCHIINSVHKEGLKRMGLMD